MSTPNSGAWCQSPTASAANAAVPAQSLQCRVLNALVRTTSLEYPAFCGDPWRMEGAGCDGIRREKFESEAVGRIDATIGPNVRCELPTA